MPDLYDRLENRTPAARESALFRDFRHILSIAKPRVPALRAQLRGVDVAAITSRADLAQIPIVRRADLLALQAENPPLGGATATRLGALKHVFLGPGALASIAGQARDWWGIGRALYAAGLRKGQLVLNCFPYDLVPDGHMVQSGAESVHSPVFPAGNADIDAKVDVIRRLRPQFFCGRSEEFKAIIDTAMERDVDTTCIEAALVTGRTSKGQRSEYELRGFVVRHTLVMPETGVIAFETDATNRMTVTEGLIIEIVDPATNAQVARGEKGEIVVTRLNHDYPLLRYGTGITSAICETASNCGRTNLRIQAPNDPKPDFVVTSGRRIHISDLREILERHPGVSRLSLVVRRKREKDEMHLRVEHKGTEIALLERIAETLHRVTNLHGTVELLAPGALSDDDAIIVDERPLN